jgi:hypothetical protein
LIARHRRSGKTLCCNLSKGGFAWAACGKPLVWKRKALGTRAFSVERSAGSTATRFPTGYDGPWKTLASTPRVQSYGMTAQAHLQEITTTGFPQPLFCAESSLRRLREVASSSTDKSVQSGTFVQKRQSAKVFEWTALTPPRMPRGGFSAWAFLIVANVHF